MTVPGAGTGALSPGPRRPAYPARRRTHSLITTAAAAEAAPAAAAAAVLAGPGLVDGQGPAVGLLAVEGGDGRLRLLVGLHLHEAEALGAAGVAVHDDLGRLHRAVGLEQLREV